MHMLNLKCKIYVLAIALQCTATYCRYSTSVPTPEGQQHDAGLQMCHSSSVTARQGKDSSKQIISLTVMHQCMNAKLVMLQRQQMQEPENSNERHTLPGSPCGWRCGRHVRVRGAGW